MEISSNINDLFTRLQTPARIVTVCHQNPDGDAIGSSMGLAHFLKTLGHTVTAISPNVIPDYLLWLYQGETMIDAEADFAAALKAIEDAEIIFTLDFGVLNRCAQLEAPVRTAKGIKVNIDHHLEPESFAHFVYRDTNAVATCELVYRFINDLNLSDKITPASANALYTGILTDSGWFSHGRITPETHRSVARLIERGANMHFVNYKMNNSYSADRMRFVGYCLAEKMQVLPEYHTAFITVTLEEQEQYNIMPGDTEGLVNYALSLAKINLGLLLVERPDVIRLSFRSIGQFSAREFALQFGGGGHYNAAGAKVKAPLREVESRFLELLKGYKEALDYSPY